MAKRYWNDGYFDTLGGHLERSFSNGVGNAIEGAIGGIGEFALIALRITPFILIALIPFMLTLGVSTWVSGLLFDKTLIQVDNFVPYLSWALAFFWLWIPCGLMGFWERIKRQPYFYQMFSKILFWTMLCMIIWTMIVFITKDLPELKINPSTSWM